MELSKEEKDYLFSKLEYKKKKTCIEKKNDLYDLLKGDKKTISDDEFSTILKSLEFTFRKRLMGSKPDLNNDLFKSIKSKLPEGTMAVKQSKINYKPSKNATKSEIVNYLKAKKIKFDEDDTKPKLLSLLESTTFIKSFSEFSDIKI